jgi:Rod binding domain-containing protein
LAISLPSDIIMDVARAADPAAVEAARSALAANRAAAAVQAPGSGFTERLSAFRADAGERPDAVPKSYQHFEAMVLQTFIQNMLPKDGAAVYGKGMAGDMWKSLLAEKVATVVAERGGIGIADRMLSGRYAGEAKPAADTATTGSPASAGNGREIHEPLRIAPVVLDRMQHSLSELLTEAAARSANDEVQFTNG